MDAATLEKLGATVTKVAAEYSRKLGDGNFGSIGASMTVEASLSAGVDPDTAANALYEFCKTAVARNLKPEAVAARAHPEAGVTLPAGTAVTPMPPPAQPVQQAELEPTDVAFDEIAEPTIGHVMTNNGDHACKVFGKGAKGANYEVWGVWAWDNMVDTAAEQGLADLVGWRQWPLCKSSKQGFEKANRYQIPGAKVAIVQMKEKDGKVVADKAIGFK